MQLKLQGEIYDQRHLIQENVESKKHEQLPCTIVNKAMGQVKAQS
jgi:hypothetical protein